MADAGLMHNKIYTVSFEPGLHVSFRNNWDKIKKEVDNSRIENLNTDT